MGYSNNVYEVKTIYDGDVDEVYTYRVKTLSNLKKCINEERVQEIVVYELVPVLTCKTVREVEDYLADKTIKKQVKPKRRDTPNSIVPGIL